MEQSNIIYIEESANGALTKKIDEIIYHGKSKNDIINKVKAMDKKYGEEGSGEYNKIDILNAIIGACFALPSLSAIGGGWFGAPLLGFKLLGLTVGITGLYLSGLLHEKVKRKYDKKSMLTHTMSKVEKRVKTLEEAAKKETDPKMKKAIEDRLKDAKATVRYCDKELHKIERSKREAEDANKKTDDEFDFDIDMDVDFDDWSVELESAILEEKVKSNDSNPVYIVLVEGGSIVSKSIKAFTNTVYSHAGICLRHDLTEIYSFNMKKLDSINHKGGISKESISTYIDDNNEGRLKVLAVFLKKKDYNLLKDNIQRIVDNATNTSFNAANFINIIINRSIDTVDNTKLICSQFVDRMFKIIDMDLTNKESNLVTPADISRLDSPKIYEVYDGKSVDFDEKKLKNKMNKVTKRAEYIKENEIVTEAKEFAMQFDNEGNLLIKNPSAMDIPQEHSISKKLFPTYKSNRNLDGMKYEAYKLWYMNLLLLKKIDKASGDKKEELMEMRSKVLNEFTLYIKEISKLDKSFNFQKEYQDTPFGKDKIKISGSTIKYSTQYLKMLFK